MQRKKIILTGIIFFVALSLLIWGVAYLRGNSYFKGQRTYYAMYDQVGGLNVGSPVTIKGYKIGQINEIEFSDNVGSHVIVSFDIKKDFKIPKGSKAQIFNVDVMGTKGLRIIPSNQNKFYAPGDTLKSSIEVSMLDNISNELQPLMKKTEQFMKTLDTATKILTKLVVENKQDINLTISKISSLACSLDAIGKTLEEMTDKPNGKIYRIVDELESVSNMLKNNSPQLSNAIHNLSSISDSLVASNLKQTIKQTKKLVDDLDLTIKNINEGKGSLGKLSTNDSLYNSLNEATKSLKNLIIDIQKNPRKYLRMSIIDLSSNKTEVKEK
jgi:phospholipid/cholesterol/gamma-HCH transport system substrate-binding protein